MYVQYQQKKNKIKKLTSMVSLFFILNTPSSKCFNCSSVLGVFPSNNNLIAAFATCSLPL